MDQGRGSEAKRRDDVAKRDRDRKRIESLGASGIPRRFHDRTLDNYRCENEGQANALGFARAYAEAINDRVADGGSLIFCGNVGTGKTHLAAAIGHAALAQGRSVVFRSVLAAIRSVKETFSGKSSISESQAVENLIAPDLLILDEVGVQFGTTAERMILFEIINRRYEEMRPSILLMNLTLDESREYLGDRILDRMREGGGAVVAFGWESMRGEV